MPSVAVVVATRNRQERLRRLLDALRAQTHRDVEIVVVDDGATDGTAALLDAVDDLPLTVIRAETSHGPSVARDDGWRATSAPLVAFTDDDCEPGPDWLAALVAAHADQPDAILQGPTAPSPREAHLLGTPGSRTQRVEALGPFFQCCNVAYPRTVLEKVGGFDRRLPWGGEDTDLAWRALERGTPTRWVAEARVEHAVTAKDPVAFLRSAGQFEPAIRLLAVHAGLRAEVLQDGVFWKREHRLLLQALAAAAVARRGSAGALAAAALAAPYARSLRARANGERRWLAVLPAYDLLETAATLRGGLRHGRLVL